MNKLSPYYLHNRTMIYIYQVVKCDRGHFYRAPRLFVANQVAIATAISAAFAELLKATVQTAGALANGGIRTIRLITCNRIGGSVLRVLPELDDVTNSVAKTTFLIYSIFSSLMASFASPITSIPSKWNVEDQLQKKLFEFDGIVPPPNLAMNELVDFFSKKNSNGETVLHNRYSLKANLPMLLERLSTADLEKLFRISNDLGCKPRYFLTEALFRSLTRTQRIRLVVVMKLYQGINFADYSSYLWKILENIESTNFEKIIDIITNDYTLNRDEQNTAIAHIIEIKKINIATILSKLGKPRLLELAPYLRYIHFQNFNDTFLANEILKKCPNINVLIIKNGGNFLNGITSLPNCQTLELYDSLGDVHVPELPQCTKFQAANCPRLHLPHDLPICQNFGIRNCYGVRNLPTLLKCETVNIQSCHDLTAINELPNCQTLNCNYCDRLETMPAALPNCRHLDYSHCPRLAQYPQVLFGTNVICESAPKFQSLVVDIETLAASPMRLLYNLGNVLFSNRAFPNVQFYKDGKSSSGVDAGGLRRDFVTRLCENLFKLNGELGKFLTLTEELLPFISKDHDESKAYQTLGLLFALCYLGTAHIKTGPLLNPIMYKFLTAVGELGSDEWKMACHQIIAREKLSFLSPALIDALLSNGKLPQATPKELEKLAYLENDDEPDYENFTQDYLNQNREQIRQKILHEAEMKLEKTQTLRAVYWIGQMMKDRLGQSVWNRIKANGAEALQGAVEGFVDGPSLKAHLEWSKTDSVTPAKFEIIKGFLTTWIDEAPVEKLHDFVRYVSGCKTLSGAKLKMMVYDRESGSLPEAHTCFFSLDLSGNCQSQPQFNHALEMAIAEGLSGTGFTFG